jgi:hypothetical protein
MTRFPARKVTISRVYMVDCEDCGAVNQALGDCETPAQARQLKQDHVDRHRQAEVVCPDADAIIGYLASDWEPRVEALEAIRDALKWPHARIVAALCELEHSGYAEMRSAGDHAEVRLAPGEWGLLAVPNQALT